MFFIYSTTPIILNSFVIPSKCLDCNHEIRRVTIYKHYFRIFGIPLIPLRKKASVSCPICGNVQSKKKFIKDHLSFDKDDTNVAKTLNHLIKSTKTPWYPSIILTLVILLLSSFVGLVIKSSRENEEKIALFRQNPKENVFLLAKNEHNESFPYSIFFVHKIDNNYTTIFPSKYGYSQLSTARSVIKSFKIAFSNDVLGREFEEPLIVDRDIFLEFPILHIQSLDMNLN